MMDFKTTPVSVLEQLCTGNTLVYLMGDYKADLFNSETHNLINQSICGRKAQYYVYGEEEYSCM